MKNIFCIHPLFLYSFRSDRIIDLVILWGIIILIYIFLTWGDPFMTDKLEGFDLNTEFDWAIAELILNIKLNKRSKILH
jgi:hypothetical protein